MMVQSTSVSISIEQQWQALAARPQEATDKTASTDPASGTDIAASTSGVTVQRGWESGSGAVKNLTGTFADEMTKALAGVTGPDGKTQDPTDLVDSLTKAVDSIRDIAGDGAASAAMGILLKKAKSGTLTEDSMRDGMLEAMNFVDQNVGVDAGDKVMNVFNGTVNDKLNAFFNNGKDEHFAVLLKDGTNEATFDSARSAAQALSQYAQANMSAEDAAALPSADGDLSTFFKNFPGQTFSDFLKSVKDKSSAQAADSTNATGDTAAADPTDPAQAATLTTTSLTIQIERLTLFTDSGEISGQTDPTQAGTPGAAQAQGAYPKTPYDLLAAPASLSSTGLALNIPV